MQRLTPRPEQEAAIQALVTNTTGGALNASLTSAGKTLMHVEQGIRMGAERVVIIGPLGTVDGWQKAMTTQSGGSLQLRHITSKKEGMQHYDDLISGEAGWYFIGREFFRSAKIDPEKMKHVDLGIYDEIQMASNRDSKGHKKLMHFKPDYRVACSATWFGNKVENMWSVTRWVWPELTDRSFWRWANQWLTMEYDPFAGKKITGEKIPGAYAKSLPLYVRIEPTLVELMAPEERWVDLTPTQKKMYDQMEKNMFVQLTEEDYLVVEFPIAMRTRLRQLTMATFDTRMVERKGELVEEVFFPDGAKSSKFDELMELIAENPDEPMLILSDSAQWVELAASRLENSFAWKGGVSQELRNQAKADFIDGKIKYIIGQIASLAEGVDGLQLACNTVVWASQSDSNYLNMQARGRVHRTGQDLPVRQIFIKARDTIDDEQHLNLLNKQLQINSALHTGKVISSVDDGLGEW